MPACLWVWGFGFFLGFNDLEKEGILIWVWGVRKKGFLFQVLGVQKVGFLAWVWLHFCVGMLVAMLFFSSSMCIAFAFAESGNRSVARGGSYWLNHGVLAMAVVLVVCVEL